MSIDTQRRLLFASGGGLIVLGLALTHWPLLLVAGGAYLCAAAVFGRRD